MGLVDEQMESRVTSKQGMLDQLVAYGISDQAILSAFSAVDRKEFVLEQDQDRAYGDFPLSIGYGQTISQPYVVAYMLTLLQVNPACHVLEVGSGCGYQTALLSHLVKNVVAIECVRPLYTQAKARVLSANVAMFCLDGKRGFRGEAPFDRIISGAMAPDFIPAWEEQLAIGGLLVAPISTSEGGHIWVCEKKPNGEVVRHKDMAVRFVPLV